MPKRLSGYSTDDAFIATRKRMGTRWVIHIDMSVAQLVLGVEAPPVGVPQEDNREVIESRCKDFADYVDSRVQWGIPSIMLWAPEGTVRFEPLSEINDMIDGGVEVGILYVPRNSRLSIRILDGQHRVKGFHIWVERKNAEIVKAKDHLGRARELGDAATIAEAKARVDRAERALERTEREYVGVDLVEVNTAKEAKQVFADIANHAKGMTKALTTGFDTSKIVNRVTQRIVLDSPHPLLDDRVEWNKDRLSGNNLALLSAKTVADIVRSTYVGIVGRVSKVQERTGDDHAVYAHAKRFFDALQAGFPDLLDRPAPELREDSLMGSGTMLRVFAGVWFDVTRTTDNAGKPMNPRMTDAEFVDFLKKLAPHMDAPVKFGNPWLSTGFFPFVPEDGSAGVMAPSSRAQDLRGLSKKIEQWGLGVDKMPF